MKILILTLTAQEPLVLTEGSVGNMAQQTLEYVPGNMLLGAMASLWVRQHPGVKPDDNEEFRALFLEGKVEWGHAVPLWGERACVPLPLCLNRMKNHTALPVGHEPGDDFCVFNMLRVEAGEDLGALWPPHMCPEAGEKPKWKKLGSGFMDPQSLRLPPLHKLWTIHAALGTGRQAQEGQLFGYSALAAGTRLQSQVFCHGERAAQAVQALLEKISCICVGHARSAGYGKVRVEATWQEAEQSRQEVHGEVLHVMLHSDYAPSPSWLTPVESLLAELHALTGCTASMEALYAEHKEIQAFNALWGRPRTARMVLAKGSALRVRFAKAVHLPRFMTLGADRREGYGRMECDPPYLKNAVLVPLPSPAQPSPAQPSPAQPSPAQPSPAQPGHDSLVQGPRKDLLLSLLRARAMQRQVVEQATAWLAHKSWCDFLQVVGKESRPSQSQRGNVRRMVVDKSSNTLECFQSMLKKTPGEQWQKATAPSPFSSREEKGREHLADIMVKILDKEAFLCHFPAVKPKLPGGPASDAERQDFREQAHTLFVLQLLTAWEKVHGSNSKAE